jgi:membrane protease YdiL (CAAX protease family)
MLEQAQRAITALLRMPFFVWLLIGQAWLLVNASLIAPEGMAERTQTLILVYMVLSLAFIVVTGVRPLKGTLNQQIVGFVGGMVGTIVLLSAMREIPRIFAVPAISATAATYLIILHAIVIAASEEVIFRAALPKIMTPIPAQVVFGLFHLAAYHLDWMAVLIAMVAGIILYFIADRLGLQWSIGVHAGYNLAVLVF